MYDETIKQFTTAASDDDEDRGTHDEAMLRQLLIGMQERPGYSAPMTPSTAWSLILEHGLMYRDARCGWVTREGVMLGAFFAAHERLLKYLGTTASDVEARGWARVGNGGFQCLFRLSAKQRARIKDAGLLVDDGAELLKPRWSKPHKPHWITPTIEEG